MQPQYTSSQRIHFWSRVETTGPCWLWAGPTMTSGYGKATINRRTISTHRLAWEMVFGPIPKGLFVLHRCDVRICARPSHLFLGTHADNMADMAAKGRAVSGDRHAFRCHPESKPVGERHGCAKLTEEQVREIRRIYAEETITQRELAKRFGVCQRTVVTIIHRKHWTHID